MKIKFMICLFARSSQEAVNIVHHCAFDMIDKQTLDDDVEPYGS